MTDPIALLLTAVLDANGIIGLAKAGCLSSVRHLFRVMFVPAAVVPEVTDSVPYGELTQSLGVWIIEEQPTETALQRVLPLKSQADRHVLALALDHSPCVILTGDRALAIAARQRGITTVDAPRMVQFLAEARLIPAARPCLDRMRESRFGIPLPLYEEILRSLGEVSPPGSIEPARSENGATRDRESAVQLWAGPKTAGVDGRLEESWDKRVERDASAKYTLMVRRQQWHEPHRRESAPSVGKSLARAG